MEVSDSVVKMKMSSQIAVTFEPVLDDVDDAGDSKDVFSLKVL